MHLYYNTDHERGCRIHMNFYKWKNEIAKNCETGVGPLRVLCACVPSSLSAGYLVKNSEALGRPSLILHMRNLKSREGKSFVQS